MFVLESQVKDVLNGLVIVLKRKALKEKMIIAMKKVTKTKRNHHARQAVQKEMVLGK